MFRGEARDNIRSAARVFEEALPIEQRKKLGQFFTGLPLGKLLAHLALNSDTRTVLDPMAGHGDLLDATWEAATERGLTLDRLDGIEVDIDTASECRSRLNDIAGKAKAPGRQIVAGDAFGPQSINALPLKTYDLVITNPPYVRYQSRKRNGANGDPVRSGLRAIIDDHLSGADRNVWTALAEGYSGLADLSVPSWLLAALLVRPGGRLALVVPATWRSRDYADVVRYLLLRCFLLDYIVEDKQPGWFSDALVRTHLIVARRLPSKAVAKSVNSRAKMATALWIQVAPEAASSHSLVCNSFGPDRPESQFATWVQNGCKGQQDGITSRCFDVLHERQTLEGRAARRRWYRRLESAPHDLPSFGSWSTEARAFVPDILQNILYKDHSPGPLLTLKEAGIKVGQGLRTGCNSFF